MSEQTSEAREPDHGCCGCSCSVCANGHHGGQHTDQCIERIASRLDELMATQSAVEQATSEAREDGVLWQGEVPRTDLMPGCTPLFLRVRERPGGGEPIIEDRALVNDHWYPAGWWQAAFLVAHLARLLAQKDADLADLEATRGLLREAERVLIAADEAIAYPPATDEEVEAVGQLRKRIKAYLAGATHGQTSTSTSTTTNKEP